jgi:hypothetical protein
MIGALGLDHWQTASFIAFVVSVVVLTYRLNHRIYVLNWQQWQALRQDRELVIQPRIRPFDAHTLDRVGDILIPEARGAPNNEGPTTALLAVDLGGPTGWWTNDMLGYLALQVNWATRGQGRTVRRVFVWEPSEYICLAGLKILSIHKLLGFETYLFPKPSYRRLIEKMKPLAREFLVWDITGQAVPSKPPFLSRREVWGYQSPRLLDEGPAVERVAEEAERVPTILFIEESQAADGYRNLFAEVVKQSNCAKLANWSVRDLEQEIRGAVNRWLI